MDDEYLRRYEHQEFARGVDREQVRQNKRIVDLEATVRQINDLTLSVQKAIWITCNEVISIYQRSHIVRTKTCNQYGEHAR